MPGSVELYRPKRGKGSRIVRVRVTKHAVRVEAQVDGLWRLQHGTRTLRLSHQEDIQFGLQLLDDLLSGRRVPTES